MAGERAYERAKRIKTAKWLLAEARYRANEQLPDRRTVLGHPDVAGSIAALLFMIELWWPDLPEQVQREALKAANRITNHDKPRSTGPVASEKYLWDTC